MQLEAVDARGVAERYAERAAVGRLNGIQPELGTIVGPNPEGQRFVVIGVDGEGATVGIANGDDLAAIPAAPRSGYEYSLRRL